MQSDLQTFTARVRKATTKKELQEAHLDLVNYVSDLGRSYAIQFQSFSASVIQNKEEWYKKSMIECVHQAGRDIGYQHEATKIEIEAAKALLAFICDMELVDQDEQDAQETESDTSPLTSGE
jgi:hypothetical protein